VLCLHAYTMGSPLPALYARGACVAGQHAEEQVVVVGGVLAGSDVGLVGAELTRSPSVIIVCGVRTAG
jgi:hypothetical protein